MKNRFNQISSKEWLPFQKSFQIYQNKEKLYKDAVRFFCDKRLKKDIGYYGKNFRAFSKVCEENKFKALKINNKPQNFQFILIDLTEELKKIKTSQDFVDLRKKILEIIKNKKESLEHRRFLCILAQNKNIDKKYFPFAWDIAKNIGKFLSLKDEKIICLNRSSPEYKGIFKPKKNHFYQLFFRKDEDDDRNKKTFKKNNFIKNKSQKKSKKLTDGLVDSWFILKPQRRNKTEILHPAKYPEELVNLFVNKFSLKNDFVFDPMSGTGSTQIAALKAGRNAIGTELSSFFCNIAQERCNELVNPTQKSLFETDQINNSFKLIKVDARKINKKDFKKIDYVITSPPYWDMLNMRGAENQAKRIDQGLQTNYSEDKEDYGNIEDYDLFINELKDIYVKISKLMTPGSFMTIVVKNIKKKGRNYPFAWDLSNELIPHMTLCNETFWCQDDISIAPFGYGNTWVSNTFHQYCLTFQVRN